MNPELAVEDFSAYFREVHGHPPFPWQERLVCQVAAEGKWPGVLDLPTGFGKTAALDAAVFHLALEADRGVERHAPIRIAFIVDRRLVVDDAFARAQRIKAALQTAPGGSAAWKVAERLRMLAGGGNPPLLARRLRGGIPREDDWARTPAQPTILCSTVDQVGSRLLFRGYGVSDSMKPVHAGLIGADCLILLDEAHLSEPFRQTLRWVNGYRSERWRVEAHASPWGMALLTATPGSQNESCFSPTELDYNNDVLKRRWEAAKPARLIDYAKGSKKGKKGSDAAVFESDFEIEMQESIVPRDEERQRIEYLVEHALTARDNLKKSGLLHPAVAVVVNRVARARAVFGALRERVRTEEASEGSETLLMIGPARPVDRDDLAERLGPIRTGLKERKLDRPFFIVATQCIEAGVDIDLDGLITEAAPLDALRQRFGRLNRDGREFTAYGAIVGHPEADKKDSVYGEAIAAASKALEEKSSKGSGKNSDLIVDFGLKKFQETMPSPLPVGTIAPKADAPVLLPAHLDLLTQTAPIPNADPEVSLYLHGPSRSADNVTIIWRSDVDSDFSSDEDTRRLLLLVPPRSSEAIELPIWVVRRWLTQPKSDFSDLSDIPCPVIEESAGYGKKRVFWWTGDEKSRWIEPNEIRPGCTIVVPVGCFGVDEFGWNPQATQPATDVGDKAAEAFAGRRFAVRISPQLFEADEAKDKLAAAIASASSGGWKELRDAVADVLESEITKLQGAPSENGSAAASIQIKRLETAAAALSRLDEANTGRQKRAKVQVYPDVYGFDEDHRPRGAVFLAPLGIAAGSQSREAEVYDSPNATEDDLSGSLPGYAQPLKEHSEAVESVAAQYAQRAGLPKERTADIKVAAYLHDAGKVDSRFQSWLAYDDPLGPDPDNTLAKSGRHLPPAAKMQSGLPDNWRHEALSARLAATAERFKEANDPDLVLWLIGTHHGHGRPFFPHADPADAETRTDLPQVLGIPSTLPPGPGPQSLAYDRNGLDWPALYERLKARYGVWELAHMEAVLRLADHRASEQAATEGVH